MQGEIFGPLHKNKDTLQLINESVERTNGALSFMHSCRCVYFVISMLTNSGESSKQCPMVNKYTNALGDATCRATFSNVLLNLSISMNLLKKKIYL
jgi:hypothetical protein